MVFTIYFIIVAYDVIRWVKSYSQNLRLRSVVLKPIVVDNLSTVDFHSNLPIKAGAEGMVCRYRRNRDRPCLV